MKDALSRLAVPVRASALHDIISLTKPELTLLSVVTALGGAYLGAESTAPYGVLMQVFLGTLLVGGGAGALNQYLEREYDALMRRTENRPLPSGRLEPRTALAFGLTASVAGIFQLAFFTHVLAGFFAGATLVLYLLVYTPLKRVTPFATTIGGIPGALPPVIGWTAVTGRVSMGAISLFFILYFWQMPHFLALSWMYRKDYARAGYRLLSVVDGSGIAASRQILFFCTALIPAALLPSLVGLLGLVYFAVAIVLSFAFLCLAMRLYRDRTTANARRLFIASLLYLSVLVAFMILDRAA